MCLHVAQGWHRPQLAHLVSAAQGERQRSLIVPVERRNGHAALPGGMALGVDVRGRSKTLQVNYRTSHQIREQATVC
jgi:hypothetical protein